MAGPLQGLTSSSREQQWEMENSPAQGAGSPARAADIDRTTPGMGWRQAVGSQVGKNQEKQGEKAARQAGREKP